MATNTPRYDQETLASNSGKNVTRVNSLARVTDAFLAGARVIDDDLLAQPGSPAEGDLYLLPASGSLTGAAWSTFTNGNLALFINAAWLEIVVDALMEGVTIRLVDESKQLTYTNGEGWVEKPSSVQTAIAAAGTTQGAAFAITFRVSEVTAITAASAEAVVLPAAFPGLEHVIVNDDGTDTLKVFPAAGDSIDAAATNASVDLLTGEVGRFYAIDTNKWYSHVGVHA